jgi:hypothetical protein
MKTQSILQLFAFALLALLSGCGTDFDDNLHAASPAAAIEKDSYLYAQIEKVAGDTDDPANEIVCIDFIYPLQLLVYDSGLQPLETVSIYGDDDFSAFLGALPDGQSISISYPIETTMADGTTFSVNNNDELKMVIDSCSRPDLIAYCNGLFSNVTEEGTAKCYWKVAYLPNADNRYVGGVFEANEDGSLTFSFRGETFQGTWVFLFAGDEFHININLEGTSSVAADWNIDRRVFIAGETIGILNPDALCILEKACEVPDTYAIGDTGPAGGTVFYDKGQYSHGWRYMEAAPADLPLLEWGCNGSAVQNGENAAIGLGMYLSGTVANFHDALDDYYQNPGVCNSLNNGTVAAREALLLDLNGYTDWFLPSSLELALVYANLHLQGFGSFTATRYWSSSEIDAGHAQTIDFTDGSAGASSKIPTAGSINTRTIRYF